MKQLIIIALLLVVLVIVLLRRTSGLIAGADSRCCPITTSQYYESATGCDIRNCPTGSYSEGESWSVGANRCRGSGAVDSACYENSDCDAGLYCSQAWTGHPGTCRDSGD
jgi:hypothetical protein